MQFGFVKVCAATPKIKVADVKFNTKEIINCIFESSKKGSRITVFPELCITGYTCADLFNQSVLISAVEKAVKDICDKCSDCEVLAFVGAPVKCGGKLFNCAVAICSGKILGIIPKTYLPNYGEFYEMRNFCSAPAKTEMITFAGQNAPFGTDVIFKAENYDGLTVSAEICEDLWAPLSPSIRHTQAGANVIVNLSCSNETVGKAEYRKNLVKTQSAKLLCGYVYSDAGDGESTTDAVFAGHNIICENGAVLAESNLFENGLIYSEIDVQAISFERAKKSSGYYDNCFAKDYYISYFKTFDKSVELDRKFSRTPFIPRQISELNTRAQLILNIQSKGLQKRLLHTQADKAIVGVSGGLDSALALLVTCRAFKALGKDLKNIIAVTMPGFGTTSKTKNNSVRLPESLGVTVKEIPITQSVLRHFKDIEHPEDKTDVTYENAQARMRTLILMDLANKYGGLVIGTGDLSELALGWATYGGDHISMYNVNSSVPKTLIKYLVSYEAEKEGGELGDVLKEILSTEISPELLPPLKNGEIKQKTEDLVGPYILHDFFLYYSIRWGFSPEKVLYVARQAFKDEYDGKTVLKWLKVFYNRFFAQQFKRSCSPDGVKVGSVSLSPRADWKMPSDAVAECWLNNLE